MKYYEVEHQSTYERIAASGKSSWDELHGAQRFEDALVRQFIALALPYCSWESSSPHALEYGCGTGPGACHLAERGFVVTGIDLNPIAITLAEREKEKRGLKIEYRVGDLCSLQDAPLPRYDLVVDSFCLQSIVTDVDRSALMRFVRNHLQPNGYYLICSAGFSAQRRYDEALFDSQTGMVYVAADAETEIDGLVEIDGKHYRPYRRHLRVAQLISEVARFDFTPVWQHIDTHGNIALLAIA